MGYPRCLTVHAEAPGFYHCISRCVRRAWLCGEDPVSGKNFDHRRAWIEQRLLFLADSFAVGLYAWAVMSNHTHVVLRIDPGLPASWSDEEVAWRWARLSRTLVPVSEPDAAAHARQLTQSPERIEVLRQRLGSLSWFMRFLNEAIARSANAEDGCSGRFWEGRYRCQALLDDESVLACMAYVDLNPIRAGIADDLHSSEFTSVRRRLQSIAPAPPNSETVILPIAGVPNGKLPVSLAGYITLVEWTGRISRIGRRRTSRDVPSALGEIRGSPDWWVGSVPRIEQAFGSAVGNPNSLRKRARATGRAWLRGI